MLLSERLPSRRVAQRSEGTEAHRSPRPCGDQPRRAAMVQTERPVLPSHLVRVRSRLRLRVKVRPERLVLPAHRAADAVERARVPGLGAVEGGGGDLGAKQAVVSG